MTVARLLLAVVAVALSALPPAAFAAGAEGAVAGNRPPASPMTVAPATAAGIASSASATAGASADAIAAGLAEPPYHPDAIPESQYRDRTGEPQGSADSDSELTSGNSTLPEYFLAIYSGSTTGSYFSVATTICDVMELRFLEHRVRCVPLRSQGVGSNRRLMREGRAQVVLVQSDTNWMAANGTEPIAAARSVASVHDEAGLLVVRGDSRIDAAPDLRGKRVNIGPDGSATQRLWQDFLNANDVSEQDLGTVYKVEQDYNLLGLCEDFIDAYGLWIGHPTPTVAETLQVCPSRLVGMGGRGAERLIAERPYLYPQVVPAGTYAGQAEDLQTYGFKAVLMADRRADPHVIYWLTRTLVEDIDELRRRNPILGSLSAEDMVMRGNFLPFHEGAARYWRERGVLPPETPQGGS